LVKLKAKKLNFLVVAYVLKHGTHTRINIDFPLSITTEEVLKANRVHHSLTYVINRFWKPRNINEGLIL